MKSEHAVLLAAFLYVAMIAFAAGGISVTAASSIMPHGVLEYWLDRYQTLITGLSAIGGLWLVYLQLKNAGRQHRSIMLFNLEPERRALSEVMLFARASVLNIVGNLTEEQHIEVMPMIRLGRPDAQTKQLISNHCDPHIARAFDRLDEEVENFNLAMEIKRTDPVRGVREATVAYRQINARSQNLRAYSQQRWRELSKLYEI